MSDLDDDDEAGPALPAGQPNYMTLGSYNTLQAEALHLLDIERPDIVKLVHWAASNGDRSENADYKYGKQRLREIDRRVGYIQKRLRTAVVVNPAEQLQRQKVFFGATVEYCLPDGESRTVTIVGLDEANAAQGKVSFVSPIARALLGKAIGDESVLYLPVGKTMVEIEAVHYPSA